MSKSTTKKRNLIKIGLDKAPRADNGKATRFKKGEGGRPPGAKNRITLQRLVTQEMIDQALANLVEGLELKSPVYTQFVIDKMLPKPIPETFLDIDLSGVDLEDLEGIKKAGNLIVNSMLIGELSIEITLQILAVLEKQHGLILTDIIQFVTKYYNDHKGDMGVVGSAQTTMTEEEFNKITAITKDSQFKDQVNSIG